MFKVNKRDATQIYHVFNTFINNEYGLMGDIKDMTVVDGGASIGDTAIFFALKGARYVIAYEPIPSYYNLLVENIELNKLNGIVEPRNYAIWPYNTTLKLHIPQNWKGKATCIKEFIERGRQDVEYDVIEVKAEPPPKANILKLDCEGCEYPIILNWLNSPIYEKIILEYHNTYHTLAKKLISLGYKVKVLRRQRTGLIYAVRDR